MLFQCGDRIGVDQSGAAFSRHDRIDNERDSLRALAQHRGQGLDDRGIMQHAGLDRVGADIVEHDLDLLTDKIGRDRQHAENPFGVLRRQSGYRGCRVTAEHRDGLDVGLDSGAAA